MKLGSEIKKNAISLRKKGYSIKEVAKLCKISVGTASLWLREIKLSEKAKERIQKRRILGKDKARNFARKRKTESIKIAQEEAEKELQYYSPRVTDARLLVAFLFWAEGEKTDQNVTFINSDPKMVQVFLKLFRTYFDLDDSKFRALVHIHEYHSESKIIDFWTDVTDIPREQFQKTYKKKNTGIRKKENYKGSISIRYYDAQIARKLFALYNTFTKNIGVSVNW